MSTMTGGEYIARALAAEDVEHVFGIMDGTYLGLCAGLVGASIDLVTPRHETSAAHMAGTYARLTGKIGVCIASNGPGVANVLPGVAVENAEGNRVLLITSSRRTGIAYPDRGGTYQCFDQVAAIQPISKWSESAASFARIPELMRRALRQCYAGRPGVVHLDVPEDLLNNETEAQPVEPPRTYRRTTPTEPPPAQIEAAAQLLSDADLPAIHAGGGIAHAGAFAELATVAELLHAPVTTSWSGRGAFPETSELAWPMPLIEACDELNNAADVVLCLGSRIGETDWWGKPPHWRAPADQRLIQIDIDEDVLGQNKPADLAIVGDARIFLDRLAAQLEATTSGPTQMRIDAVARLAKTRDDQRSALNAALDDTGVPMNTAHIATACQDVFGDDAVSIFDGGNTAVWANFYHEVRVPHTVVGTPHMGHLGAGVGQALGAAVARPGELVCCIIGDGAFGMHPQEIESAVRNDLPVVFVVVSDKQWGMVKMTQIAARGPDTLINPDLGEIAYDKLAESMGAHGERVADPALLRAALERCVAAERCAVVHVDVDAMKHLMAPGLLHFKAMHQEPGTT